VKDEKGIQNFWNGKDIQPCHLFLLFISPAILN